MSERFRFSHAAMATMFDATLSQPGISERYAMSAANALFAEIDRLEDELSRFRPCSDIFRISRLKKGESLALGLAAWDCLSLAKAVHAETSGAFDITIGPLMSLWRDADGGERQPSEAELDAARQRIGAHLFDLDPDGLRITVHADHLVCDLGALGKGYALDQAAELLADWEISHALLNAGTSTLLAVGILPGEDGWAVGLDEEKKTVVKLKDEAISASGFAVKGAHIMNPRTFQPVPVRKTRAYVKAPTAAMSDALSTAFTVMEPGEAASFCQRHPEISIVMP